MGTELAAAPLSLLLRNRLASPCLGHVEAGQASRDRWAGSGTSMAAAGMHAGGAPAEGAGQQLWELPAHSPQADLQEPRPEPGEPGRQGRAHDSPIPDSLLQDPVGPGSELALGAQRQLAGELLDEGLGHHGLPVTDRLDLQGSEACTEGSQHAASPVQW